LLCFLVAEKIKLKVLICAFETYQLKNPSSNPLKRKKAAIFTLKMIIGSRL
jgi:hypothetical protein